MYLPPSGGKILGSCVTCNKHNYRNRKGNIVVPKWCAQCGRSFWNASLILVAWELVHFTLPYKLLQLSTLLMKTAKPFFSMRASQLYRTATKPIILLWFMWEHRQNVRNDKCIKVVFVKRSSHFISLISLFSLTCQYFENSKASHPVLVKSFNWLYTYHKTYDAVTDTWRQFLYGG